MTERENFLERWSRKKAEAQRESTEATDPSVAAKPADAPDAPDIAAPPGRRAEAMPPSPAVPKPEFDLASLPSLDSITAATDIRGFLAPGVPQELTRAALRRAWLADPAIRDFVGLQENDWDFTNPEAVPGFGGMPPGYDIRKMISQIFGEADQPPRETTAPERAQTLAVEAQAPTPAELTQAEASLPATGPAGMASDLQPASMQVASQTPSEPSQSNLVQRESNVAMRQDGLESDSKSEGRRPRHGGALPKS
jgi:hypothetical protein